MNKAIILFLLLIFSVSAFADVNGDLNNFFDGLGMATNVTAPHAYQGQQAGYYSGGSIFSRNAVRNVQLVQVDLPSFRAGCGGIDLFAGGMSFVNKDELIATMRNIMNSAKGYG
jgi:conjugative transfer pilus assembly protein TraH